MQNYENEVHPNVLDIKKELSIFEKVFAKELTADLAHSYVSSLEDKLGGIDQNPYVFAEKGKSLHYEVGKEIYGPLIAGYCQWIAGECQNLDYHGNVYFALRDAAPLQVAAEIVWSKNTLIPVGIYANRPILGIHDEIAPETSQADGEVKAYFEKKGLQDGHKIIWSDTGAWGTVIQVLKTKYFMDKELYPFFWYSHNPHIPGYLNNLLGLSGLEDKFGEILNDSMECMFPQQYLRPLQLMADSSDVILQQSNYLAALWGPAALEGVKAGVSVFKNGITEGEALHELERLHILSEQAKKTSEWTGVLPTNTPTWSHGAEFLAEFDPSVIGKGSV